MNCGPRQRAASTLNCGAISLASIIFSNMSVSSVILLMYYYLPSVMTNFDFQFYWIKKTPRGAEATTQLLECSPSMLEALDRFLSNV